MNFKFFSPLQRLHVRISETKAFDNEPKIDFFGGRRYHRFAACSESFRNNLLGLRIVLARIGEHFHLTYTKADRLSPSYFSINHALVSMDLETFILKVKGLLDCIAFFVPFYYKNPLCAKLLNPDARDSKDPWAFRSMKNHIVNGKTKDEGFKKILKENEEWMEDLLWRRDILTHKFHRMTISQDYWTYTSWAYLYEFNKTRDFVPDVLSYVSLTYFKLVKFLNDYEVYFKYKLEKEFSEYKYADDASSYAAKIDKIHFFYLSYGRILDGKLLIRVHPNLRGDINNRLIKIINSLKINCKKCNQVNIHLNSKLENYILINARCECGHTIHLNNSVWKRFFPHYYDRNQKYYGLVPEYSLEERKTF